MVWLLHLVLLSIISLALYLVYAAVFKDYARRNYEAWRRYPAFRMWPKGLRQFTAVYKALLISSLLALVAMYVLLIVKSPYL